MGQVLGVLLGFPVVVFTGGLALALVYWLFVLVGAAGAELGDAADAAADGALEGGAKGALEGATKGVLEAAAHGADVDVDAGGDLDADAHADAPEDAGGILASLKLRSAPATIVLTCILFFSWLISMAAVSALARVGLTGGAVTAAQLAVLVLSPLLALLPTSLAVRPFERTLNPVQATKRAQLVGQLCTIRTGTVTDRFGEATLEDGGSGLVVRVRVDAGEKLARGDQAVIVGYDEEREEFSVAPLPSVDEPDADDASMGDRKKMRAPR